MVDCVCTYVCRAGLLLPFFFFLHPFQMAFSSVHKNSPRFFTTWLHIVLSVISSVI